jgi:hypothetical protein
MKVREKRIVTAFDDIGNIGGDRLFCRWKIEGKSRKGLKLFGKLKITKILKETYGLWES